MSEEKDRIRNHKNRDKAVETLERQKIRNSIRAVDQLKILDERLGVGIGANKERNRLNRFIEEGKK